MLTLLWSRLLRFVSLIGCSSNKSTLKSLDTVPGQFKKVGQKWRYLQFGDNYNQLI